MSAGVERAALGALSRFIETFSSRDAAAWADSLHYPHARPSPRGPGLISPSARAYADAFSYDPILATGWVRSAWDERRVLHVSPDKAHVAGQWSRFDAGGRRILTNRVTYVVTRLGERWGIQARFGVDSREPDDAAALEPAIRAALEALLAGRAAHFPVLEIDPGAVREIRDARPRGRELAALELVQAGERGVNAAVELAAAGGAVERGVVLLTRPDGGWGVQALSTLSQRSE